MSYQIIPCEITSEICKDLISHRPSLGSLNRFAKECYKKLKKTELNIKTSLVHSEILNVDETGINCNGKLEWLHIASNENLTHFASHKDRGMQAMQEIGIIPEFHGILIHDNFQPYFDYKQAKHGLCNAHHLRELTYV